MYGNFYGWINNTQESRFYTRSMCIKRLRFDTQVNNVTVPREETVNSTQLFVEAATRRVAHTWRQDLDREQAKVGEGGNKLRTYARFKSSISMERYLIDVHDERKRALLFKFRAGIAPLRIERNLYI